MSMLLGLINSMLFVVHNSLRSGLGNFDHGEGHYIFTFTLEGHCAHTVKYIKKKRAIALSLSY